MLMMNFVGKPAYAETLATDHIFAANSFWYKPIPVDVKLHENSAAFVAEFLRQKSTYYGTVGINTTAYSSPVYYAEANAPTVQVNQWDCQNKGYKDQQLAKQWSAVPVPDYAQAAKGTDEEMTIYQASTDTLWEFWKARKIDGQWQACWGGKLLNASKSDGIFPEYFGTTATSLPFIGGQITAEELQRGEIKHVIGIALVDLEKFNIYSWPAHRSDGHNPKNLPNRIPEGILFRLDPSVNVDALKMHPVGKTIAKAAQKYGFVVWDKAGAITLRVQNPLSYTLQGQVNPYVELFDGTPQYAILKGMPWDRLQFLPMNYGKPLNLF
ncbi:MAG: DUF4124 domain-containing protein [Methylotenera sp.]|nr:DUF4124 domain-containing protein [Methylotenera sp.]